MCTAVQMFDYGTASADNSPLRYRRPRAAKIEVFAAKDQVLILWAFRSLLPIWVGAWLPRPNIGMPDDNSPLCVCVWGGGGGGRPRAGLLGDRLALEVALVSWLARAGLLGDRLALEVALGQACWVIGWPWRLP